MVYMGRVTLRKGQFNMGHVTTWSVSHLGRDSLYEKCHIEEGRVYMGHAKLGKGGLIWDLSH